VLAELVERTAGPVVLAGFSLGGLTAVVAAQRAPSVRGVIATTLLDPTDPDAFARASRWPWLARPLLPLLRRLPAPLEAATVPLSLAAPLGAMTADRELQRWFLEDPLLGRLRVPLRFLRTLHRTRLVDDVLPCPLLLVHPGADAWTPVELSRRTFDRLRGRKRLRVLSNGSHLPIERPAYDELREEFAGFLATIGREEGG
jgi:pimeloyl-ACP methyl ester carboxylesterase